jgi:transketolase
MIDKNFLVKIKKRLIQMHFESKVGHIGGNLSCIDSMALIFHEFLNSKDKFILSKGHSAGALYVSLWSLGILNDNDLESFHRDDSYLPGHPPLNHFSLIPFSTGSLGHGLSLAVGTALGFELSKSKNKVFCMTSDGEWQEGSSWEALVFGSHHRLKNLTILVDHNNLQGFGSTENIASMSPLWDKLKGFNLDLDIVDGHDLDGLRQCLDKKQEKLRIIFLKTIKGHGINFLENKMESHYLPLAKEQYEQAILELENS